MIGECGHELTIEIVITEKGHEMEIVFCELCNIVYRTKIIGFENYWERKI